MGIDTTREDQAPLTFASPAETAAFAGMLRTCLADDALLAQFDRLTGSNLSLSGVPINLAIDLSSGRIEAELHQFAIFVKDVVWDRIQ